MCASRVDGPGVILQSCCVAVMKMDCQSVFVWVLLLSTVSGKPVTSENATQVLRACAKPRLSQLLLKQGEVQIPSSRSTMADEGLPKYRSHYRQTAPYARQPAPRSRTALLYVRGTPREHTIHWPLHWAYWCPHSQHCPTHPSSLVQPAPASRLKPKYSSKYRDHPGM